MTEKRFSVKKSGSGLFYRDGDYEIDNTIQFIIETVEMKLNQLSDENEQLKTENTMLKEYQNINCQNCQYFVSDSFSSDCLKREDVGYKGTCIGGMDLHMLAKNCPYY